MKAHARIPLCLVTGFLGAGKTTLLERIVEQLRGRRVLYLVNEFAPMDVDGGRLDLPPGQLTAVAGGSIFCRCKVTDFIDVLGQVVEDRPEGVVIEASGIADPSAIHSMLRETGLDAELRLARCVCVVDPGTFPKVIQTLANVTAQVRTADLAVINKIDRYDAETIATCREHLLALQPNLAIATASYGAVSCDWLPGATSLSGADGQLASCGDPQFTTIVATPPGPLALDALQAACDQLGDDLYRVKGTVATADGRIDCDRAPGGWSQRPGRDPDDHLVLIGAGHAAERLQTLADQITRGVFRDPAMIGT